MDDEKSTSNSPSIPVEVLDTVQATEGTAEGKLEKAISAILHGIALLEAKESGKSRTQGPITETKIRHSVRHLKSLLTPSLYQSGKHWKFSLEEQRLMYFVGETGDFTLSCLKAGMSPDDGARFFSRGRFPRYFSERVKEAAVRRGWTVDHFIAQLDDVWTGRQTKTREQMDAIKEIGARVAPKIERVQHEFEDAAFVFETRES